LSDDKKQTRGVDAEVATRRKENNAAKVVSGEQDSSTSEQDEDELALLGKSDKDVPTKQPGLSSTSCAKITGKTLGSRELSSEVAASPEGSPSNDRKLFGRVKDNNGSDMSASPAAALFGSPSKQRRKENRRSLIFSNKPDVVDRCVPTAQQRGLAWLINTTHC
jgi:hypothetical protein